MSGTKVNCYTNEDGLGSARDNLCLWVSLLVVPNTTHGNG